MLPSPVCTVSQLEQFVKVQMKDAARWNDLTADDIWGVVTFHFTSDKQVAAAQI